MDGGGSSSGSKLEDGRTMAPYLLSLARQIGKEIRYTGIAMVKTMGPRLRDSGFWWQGRALATKCQPFDHLFTEQYIHYPTVLP